MARKKPSNHRYRHLVAGFAASAFVLLGMLASQQHQANSLTASVAETALVMTTYTAR